MLLDAAASASLFSNSGEASSILGIEIPRQRNMESLLTDLAVKWISPSCVVERMESSIASPCALWL